MEIIKMSQKELKNGEILSMVVAGEMTQRKASEEINMSLRQIKRLCKRFREEGLQGIAHRNRGRESRRKISARCRLKVLNLIKKHYPDFGPQLIKEQLESRHKLKFSREWIRCLMKEEGIWQVKKRKNLTSYQRRARRAREGELLQIDGSPHAWFEERGAKCCLINMVDDATGKIMECRFVEAENLEGYFLSMKAYLERYGRPLSVYSDRHMIFKSPKYEEKKSLTQFGCAMKELGIELIHANTPQAKGRVERSFGILQDRLVKLMRLEKVSSIEEGNRYLKGFRNAYNQRFGRVAQSKENAHRSIPEGKTLTKILCSKEKRKVSKQLEIHYQHSVYQLLEKDRRRLIGKVATISRVEGNIVIEIEGKEYEYKIYQEQPYKESIMDRKKLDAFLDRKQPMSIVQRHRKRLAVNF